MPTPAQTKAIKAARLYESTPAEQRVRLISQRGSKWNILRKTGEKFIAQGMSLPEDNNSSNNAAHGSADDEDNNPSESESLEPQPAGTAAVADNAVATASEGSGSAQVDNNNQQHHERTAEFVQAKANKAKQVQQAALESSSESESATGKASKQSNNKHSHASSSHSTSHASHASSSHQAKPKASSAAVSSKASSQVKSNKHKASAADDSDSDSGRASDRDNNRPGDSESDPQATSDDDDGADGSDARSHALSFSPSPRHNKAKAHNNKPERRLAIGAIANMSDDADDAEYNNLNIDGLEFVPEIRSLGQGKGAPKALKFITGKTVKIIRKDGSATTIKMHEISKQRHYDNLPLNLKKAFHVCTGQIEYVKVKAKQGRKRKAIEPEDQDYNNEETQARILAFNMEHCEAMAAYFNGLCEIKSSAKAAAPAEAAASSSAAAAEE